MKTLDFCCNLVGSILSVKLEYVSLSNNLASFLEEFQKIQSRTFPDQIRGGLRVPDASRWRRWYNPFNFKEIECLKSQ